MTATGLEPTTIYFINERSRPVWLNDWMFVYKLSGCGFKFQLQSLKLKILHLFGAGVPLHSGNYRGWIYSGTHTWHDKNIQPRFIGQSCLSESKELLYEFKYEYMIPKLGKKC